MRKLKIAVFTQVREYGFDLARGLCGQSSGIEALVAEDEVQALNFVGSEGVIITDKRMNLTPQTLFLSRKEAEKGEEAGDAKAICKLSPVSKILQKAVSICFDNTGELFLSEGPSRLKIWEFASRCGGSGTTSIAITCARLLAAETDEKVLYINLDVRDDYMIYTDICFDDACTKRKFIYAAQTESRIMTDNCFIADEYGVFYFKPEKAGNSFLYEAEADKILSLLSKSQRFTHIIADSGKKSKDWLPEPDLILEVSDERDHRSGDKLFDSSMEIINFSIANGDGDRFFIPADTEAFIKRKDKVEICMSSRFASAVSGILKRCLECDPL